MEEKRFDPKNLDRLNNPERMNNFQVEKIISLMALKNPERIIDLGSGTAFFSKALADNFRSCSIYACDISEVMTNWVKKNIIPHHKNIIPLTIEDNKVPLEDTSADFVFMVNLHHELEKPLETLRECYRLLKPGSFLAISDWRKELGERGPSFEIRYEHSKVKQQMEQAGFYDVEILVDFPNNFLVYGKKGY